MARHGSVGEFDHTVEDWDTYVERVEIYLTANAIKDEEQKKAVLLSVCGPETYRKIRDLAAPDKPTTLTYESIVKLVRDHYDPKRGVAVHRFRFNSRTRQEGESVSDYVAALKHLAIHCGYEASLDDMLRDRITCGINNPDIQRRLLSEAEMDFQKALKIAQAMEMAEKDALQLQEKQLDKADPKIEEAVHKTSGGEKKGTTRNPYHNCYRCGVKHRGACRHKDTICHSCGKKGHLSRVCRSKARQHQPRSQSPPNTNALTSGDKEEDVYNMFPLRKEKHDPIYVTVCVDNHPVTMEVDTGASLSVVSETTYKGVWRDGTAKLKESRVKLKTYTGEQIPVLGALDVVVEHQGNHKTLPLIITKGQGPSLLGRNWLGELRIDWKSTYKIYDTERLSSVLRKHQAVFENELGTITSTKAALQIDPQVPPQFHPPRPVPFSLRQKVEEELERLEKEGIIRHRESAEWAAPIVAVPKSDGSIRICGDYKVTVNKAMVCETHPIPRSEDLFTEMAGGTSFTKLDLSHAYLQLQLDDKARDYLVINTHKGLYEYTRMPFGITSAPAIFQRTMDKILQGLKHVVVYIDDILITGETKEDHLRTLDEVLARLEKAGVRLKKEKCVFLAPEVVYLGHRINREGLHPTDDKVQAITDMPRPTNVSKLRAFLGLVNFYGKFLKDLSTVLAPLYRLLRKGARWRWQSEEEKAFESAKSMLKSPQLLVHYDINKELVLTCDASNWGVGAVLSHRMDDGTERPIRYASRTLTSAEQNYAQVDKEALAIVYGVKQFHKYLYGRRFLICSDHKPLMYLFGEHRGISQTASARVQRWALVLSGYQYSIVHRPGVQVGNADGLSRLPVPQPSDHTPQPHDMVLLMERLNSSLVTSAHIRQWTMRDPTLSKILRQVMQGWEELEDHNCPYTRRKDELTVEQGCLLWGLRVVVPPQLRTRVIDEIHEGHPGISRMKSFARSYVWWPGIDSDLEKKVQECLLCQRNRKTPPKVPVRTWEWPEKPWSRVHVDHAGPIEGKILLIVVDAHSKWVDAHIVPSTSASAAIDKLRVVFATHGLPHTIVSDNGAAFTSSEFHQFLKQNGIEHVRSAPYHPSSNGLAERAVQTVKEGVRKMTGPLEVRLARLLFKYRVTPQATTGISPAELLMGRRLRTHLDLLHPSLKERVQRGQIAQESRTQRHAMRQFTPGDRVIARNFAEGNKWLPGSVIDRDSTTSVKIKLDDGRVWRRHVDHVMASKVAVREVSRGGPSSVPVEPNGPSITDSGNGHTEREVTAHGNLQDTAIAEPTTVQDETFSPHDRGPAPRRSARTRQPPDRYE